MTASNVHVVIPTIPRPGRRMMLARAVASALGQTRHIAGLHVQWDHEKAGGSACRNKGVAAACAADPDGWIALLDDDDALLPFHCERLIDAAEAAGVGVAWGWYQVVGGADPLPPEFRGRAYDPDAPHCVPITYVARAELFQSALDEFGGFMVEQANTGYWSQDERVLSHLVRKGGHVALPETTWQWFHHGANTSGRPDQW